jgi:curved DNA-binding protein CbpA
MKDYYKILGVKETASEEEIRERWIELTKHHHPDRGKAMASDEKIREINEAYQVLKHSSTRVEYDLRRTYGQGKKEKKKGSYFRRFGVPASILIIVIILGVIYLKPPQDETKRSNPITQTSSMNLTNITVQTDSTNPTNPVNSKNPTNSKNPKLFVASKPERVKSSTQKLSNGKDQTNPTNPMNSINPADTITPMDPTDPKNPLIPTVQAAEIQNSTLPITVAATTQKTQLLPQPQSSTTPLQNDLATYTLKDPIHTDESMVQLAQYKSPSLLATEDEVRKFFDSYIERYNRADIEGFLSLFSLKAIQNQKEGLEGIRKIYTNFFNQGREVRYRMQEMKIEIYQNAVEVRARYEIEQVLKIGGEKKFWDGQVRWVLGKENGSLKIISLNYQHQ